MPAIALPYTPADGDVLDVEALNLDIYSTTSDSLLETSNGRLDADNLHPLFTARKNHIRRGEAIDAKSVGLRSSIDYFDDVWKGIDDGEDGASFVHSIPGASLTFHQRWGASVCMVNFGIFASMWRVGELGGSIEPPTISTCLYVDGVEVPHTHRNMPITVYYREFSVNNLNVFCSEAYSTRCRNQSHMITNLTQGFHTFEVRVFVGRQNGQISGQRDYSTFPVNTTKENTGITNLQYFLSHRLRVGARNLTVLRVL